MSRSPRVLPSVLVLLFNLASLAVLPAAAAQDADQLWDDYTHYVQIARPELAAEAVSGLAAVQPGTLLDAVEASRFPDPTRIFQRAAGMESIAQASAEIQDKIQQARLERSREPQRIANNIQRLNQGQRAYENATQRLKAAGQFAAPQMLATLLDPEQATLHPALIRSMQDIGRPMVAPLSAAVTELEPVAQGQVAQILAEIGYPQALPALQQVVEADNTDPTARRIVQAAITTITRNTRAPENASAAELYLALGQGAYRTATEQPGALDTYDTETDSGVLWAYNPRLTVTGQPGLTPVIVPGPVAGDVVAMQAAEKALALDPDLDPALSLFVMANLRRENRLAGAEDPSYPAERQAPGFYAMVAGPERLHDVLDRALNDNDAELALDAIAALSATASLDALRPLVRGLGFPDRRVRFRSAQALAHAMPTESFESDFRVVPVLADAVRQTGAPMALVVTPDRDRRNTLVAAIANQGYQTLDAPLVAAASGLVANTPGVDLIVVQGDRATVNTAVTSSASNYKLAATPIVAFVDTNTQAYLSARYADNPRVFVALAQGDNVAPAVSQAAAQYSGATLSTNESTEFALSALDLLEEIAVTDTTFDINDGLAALIAGTLDARPQVAAAAGDVLSRIDAPDAQAALATAALSGTGETQIAHLIDLAESANDHGNLIAATMSDGILELVKTSTGELAVAAAQAHGALALPTRNAVDLILQP
ncbi:MAG: hypothetical protein AAGG38_09180 [Planctomycetota bacterium]